MSAVLTASRRRQTARATWPLVVVLCSASAVLVVVLGMQLSFFNDDWYFLLQRPGLESGGGLDALLAPHNGNIVVLLAGLYKLLVTVFGLGSQLPFRLVLGVTLACLGALVVLLVRERTGQIVGVGAAAVVLFLGPAWEITLFFASFSHLGALTLGLAAARIGGRHAEAQRGRVSVPRLRDIAVQSWDSVRGPSGNRDRVAAASRSAVDRRGPLGTVHPVVALLWS